MYYFGCFNIINPKVKYISYTELPCISSNSFIFIFHCHLLVELVTLVYFRNFLTVLMGRPLFSFQSIFFFVENKRVGDTGCKKCLA